DVAMVYQQFINYPAMSVYDNIASPMRIAKKSKVEIEETVERVATLLQLKPYLKRLPLELSGGQQQRTALARALAKNAKLVLLDEPLANLDPHLRGAMETELMRVHKASGATTLYITHDQREAMALADRIAVMRNGRFEQVAAPQALYDRPATEAVARFIGRAAIVPVE
ncbi:MAG: ABC transporter ATP-binding protein, partial [Pseudomonadota bacterium]